MSTHYIYRFLIVFIESYMTCFSNVNILPLLKSSALITIGKIMKIHAWERVNYFFALQSSRLLNNYVNKIQARYIAIKLTNR